MFENDFHFFEVGIHLREKETFLKVGPSEVAVKSVSSLR